MAVELVAARPARTGSKNCNTRWRSCGRSVRDKDLPTFYEADIRFHSTLTELTDNDFLVQAKKPPSIAQIAFILNGLRTVQEAAYEPLAEQQQAVVDVMWKGDPNAAAAFMRANIESWHAFNWRRVRPRRFVDPLARLQRRDY